MDETLSEQEREIIRQAGKSEKYLSAPVPEEVAEHFSENLQDFAAISYLSKSRLSELYGPGVDCLQMLQEDWATAFECGALRLHDEKAVSFPTHVQLANRDAVEVSISRNKYPTGLPWYMSYAPQVDRLRLLRDCPEASEEAHVPTEPLPPVLDEALEGMALSEDYQIGPVPNDMLSEIRSLEKPFSSFAWVPQRWAEKILECAQSDVDVAKLLDRDWAVALERNVMRCHDDKLLFPISILREEGGMLVEVAIKKDRRSDRPGAMPWFVSFVDDYVKQKVVAGKALSDWAFLGNVDELLEKLADIALEENWSFGEGSEKNRYSILRSYLTYTFYRLKTEGKVLEDEESGLAAFNTGLVDKTYEPIYACFSPSKSDRPWRFEAFCRAGSRQWGKRLVSVFNPLPKRATYFQRKEDLLFDAERPLERDVDHILLDNIDRLPRGFLEEELRTSESALDALRDAYSAGDSGEKLVAFDRLRDVIDDDYRIKRRLIHRLDDAMELAQKRVEWNFRTAVPAFYPTKNNMVLLLPLDLTEDESPDVALVVELVDSGAYIGQTILTMKMAYNNARLICRPDSDWLNTSVGTPE